MAKNHSISRITRAYICRYPDSGQRIAFVEWVDEMGKHGRTEGSPESIHIKALFDRARREGVSIAS